MQNWEPHIKSTLCMFSQPIDTPLSYYLKYFVIDSECTRNLATKYDVHIVIQSNVLANFFFHQILTNYEHIAWFLVAITVWISQVGNTNKNNLAAIITLKEHSLLEHR